MAGRRKIPGYHIGTREKHCGNCGSYSRGHCRMYDTNVNANMSCPKWWKEGRK